VASRTSDGTRIAMAGFADIKIGIPSENV
jgi:hypothetical protein